jgi:hypothetical protein
MRLIAVNSVEFKAKKAQIICASLHRWIGQNLFVNEPVMDRGLPG